MKMGASFDLRETFDILARTPAVLDTLLRRTASSWHAINEGAGTWSAFDVVGHLIFGEETDWVPRARIILEHGQGTEMHKATAGATSRSNGGTCSRE